LIEVEFRKAIQDWMIQHKILPYGQEIPNLIETQGFISVVENLTSGKKRR